MGSIIHPIHQRLAELWTIRCKRVLTKAEQMELDHCLQTNAKLCWEMAGLENMSLLASMVGDIEWQHELCRDIDHFPHKPSTE